MSLTGHCCNNVSSFVTDVIDAYLNFTDSHVYNLWSCCLFFFSSNALHYIFTLHFWHIPSYLSVSLEGWLFSATSALGKKQKHTSSSIGKAPDAQKDWRQEEKGMTEDEMVGWYHRLDGHEFNQTLGVGDGQGGLACCSPWVCKESDMTWATELKWTEMENRELMLTSQRDGCQVL